MEQLKANLVKFIKWTLIQLACNSSFDHRNYSHDDYETCRLQESIELHDSIDLGIENVVDELFSDSLDISGLDIGHSPTSKPDSKLVSAFNKIVHNNNSDSHSIDENEYQLRQDIFNTVIDFIGLYEINSLHGDDRDEFLETFYEFIER